MKRAFGNNYKETSLIWDPAAGTRNLTRDYQYSSLYISTIHDAEIQMGNKYNSEAKAAFQYDFLNDDVNLNPLDNPDPNNWKIPNSLFYDLKNAAITGKRVIFYTNPPYGTATNVQGLKRMYQTANPKIFGESAKNNAQEKSILLASMYDESKYGEVFFSMGFGQAVSRDILTDYKVMVLAVDEAVIQKDMGSQYTSAEFEIKLQHYDIKHSYSLKGHPYDNGRIEVFHSLLKREEVYAKSYRNLIEVQESIG